MYFAGIFVNFGVYSLCMNEEEKIRPYIQYEGGDVRFEKLEDDIVYVSVHGACVGCMALDYTLKEGVEALLLDEVEGIKEVRLIDEYVPK